MLITNSDTKLSEFLTKPAEESRNDRLSSVQCLSDNVSRITLTKETKDTQLDSTGIWHIYIHGTNTADDDVEDVVCCDNTSRRNSKRVQWRDEMAVTVHEFHSGPADETIGEDKDSVDENGNQQNGLVFEIDRGELPPGSDIFQRVRQETFVDIPSSRQTEETVEETRTAKSTCTEVKTTDKTLKVGDHKQIRKLSDSQVVVKGKTGEKTPQRRVSVCVTSSRILRRSKTFCK